MQKVQSIWNMDRQLAKCFTYSVWYGMVSWIRGAQFVQATLASSLKRILARVQIDSMGKWSGLVSCSQEVMRKELAWGGDCTAQFSQFRTIS